MKIAHILGSLGMGGAERVALDLAVVQAGMGHEVCVISLSATDGGAMAPEFLEAGIAVHRVAKRPGLDLSLPPRVARKLRQLRAEVAHTHNTPPLVYAAAAARLAGLGVVHTKHGEGHLVSRAGKILRRLGAPFVQSFVAVSEGTAEHARRQRVYPFPGGIHVIPNGIRLDKHSPNALARARIRAELGIAEDAWVVGTMGRVDENKNHALLIDALDEHFSEQLHLIVVGEGPATDALRRRAASANRPDSVHLLGRRNDAADVLAAFDVFALPSLSEGLPLVILEAMATAVPVVSTAVGGIPRVIESEATGFLVRPGDPSAMAEVLQRLRGDAPLCRSVGARARSFVLADHSAEQMAESYLRLYRSAIR